MPAGDEDSESALLDAPLPPLVPGPPEPPQPPKPPPPPPTPPPEPVAVPLHWIVDFGSAPVTYRALLEIARIPSPPERLASLVYAFEPAVRLAVTQRPEGTWYNSMLAVPEDRSRDFEGVGTILAFRRLLEYGWDREAPPLFHARRLLFRLLAEDNDPSMLYELGEKAKLDEDHVRRSRVLLREAAAAALAQAGYESDPRLRGAALRLIQRAMTFLRSPQAADPWIVVGGKRVLAPGANPPSYFLLLMLAHMPLFRLEHAKELDEILKYLTSERSTNTSVPVAQSAAQRLAVTADPLAEPHLVETDVVLVLSWLELAARLGYLRRHEAWVRTYDRLLEQCDDGFVWRSKRGQISTRVPSPFVWPAFPLAPGASPDQQAAEMSFRLALIARHAGRPLEFV